MNSDFPSRRLQTSAPKSRRSSNHFEVWERCLALQLRKALLGFAPFSKSCRISSVSAGGAKSHPFVHQGVFPRRVIAAHSWVSRSSFAWWEVSFLARLAASPFSYETVSFIIEMNKLP